MSVSGASRLDAAQTGTFVAVVGPSGSGKDSLIDYARARAGSRVLFARRAITRPPGDLSERHVSMTETEYADSRDHGRFALTWSAHGLNYALPSTIDDHLRGGGVVVANISRTVLPVARARFPVVVTLAIDVNREVRAARLLARGRETPEAISARLLRAVALPDGGCGVVMIDNSGPIERAGDRIVALLADL